MLRLFSQNFSLNDSCECRWNMNVIMVQISEENSFLTCPHFLHVDLLLDSYLRGFHLSYQINECCSFPERQHNSSKHTHTRTYIYTHLVSVSGKLNNNTGNWVWIPVLPCISDLGQVYDISKAKFFLGFLFKSTLVIRFTSPSTKI